MRVTGSRICGAVATGCALLGGVARAQAPGELPAAPAPTAAAIRSYQQALPQGVRMETSTGTALPLSLDEAVDRALKNNVRVETTRQNDERVRGLQSTVLNYLLPNLTAVGMSNAQEINLAAMGFKPQALGPVLQQFGLSASSFQSIVKVNVTSAQLQVSQQLFNVPAFFLYRAARRAEAVSTYELLNVRGQTVEQTGDAYLRVLADESQIENARALLESDRVALRQAQDRQAAGVGVHLDTLRAQVQVKTQEQAVISAEDTLAKDRIALNRLMGLAADQPVQLTDTMPYEQLPAMTHPEQVALAYTKRKDLLSLQAQQDVADKTEKATKFDRLPTIAMGGFYGVIGETTGLYHGYFTAQGSVNIPIFKEAQFRGEHEVAVSQMMGLRQQIASLKVTIDQQIRASELDVATANEMVRVARSNVELSRQELKDSEDRFGAGVTDNLPVVEAQSTLAAAETQLVQATFSFNMAKLALARSTGVTESQYKVYLGR